MTCYYHKSSLWKSLEKHDQDELINLISRYWRFTTAGTNWKEPGTGYSREDLEEMVSSKIHHLLGIEVENFPSHKQHPYNKTYPAKELYSSLYKVYKLQELGSLYKASGGVYDAITKYCNDYDIIWGAAKELESITRLTGDSKCREGGRGR